jgi:hypothetical protein
MHMTMLMTVIPEMFILIAIVLQEKNCGALT